MTLKNQRASRQTYALAINSKIIGSLDDPEISEDRIAALIEKGNHQLPEVDDITIDIKEASTFNLKICSNLRYSNITSTNTTKDKQTNSVKLHNIQLHKFSDDSLDWTCF